ncbi:hypothetical protein [Streptosporangium sp. NPDC023615]|uniref:hypothetical protein n=1 Tax=Streptosporangium sp. NPDC023615 TaxID=3154794 RepID=UPI003423DCFE
MTTTPSASVQVSPAILPATDGETHVLALLRRGTPVPAVSDATTWPAAAIRKLAARHRMLINTDGIAYSPDATYYARQVQAIGRADLAELLALAEACAAPKVRRALARLRHDAALLREHLIAHERAKADLVGAQQVAAEASEEIERLAARLELAKEQLRQARQTIDRHDRHAGRRRARSGASTTAGTAKGSAEGPAGSGRRYQPGVDYSTSEARAWAKANGHSKALPVSGRYVPDHVIDAMRAAQPAQSARPARAGRPAPGQRQPSTTQEVAA